ncbi:MAG: TonB C-terminal domain-containing protein [Candidatus Gastranaerophilaceae bacterium]|jgi:outer membrane biosynthesis protein TonB
MNTIKQIDNKKNFKNPFFKQARGISIIQNNDESPVSLMISSLLSALFHSIIAVLLVFLTFLTASQLVEKPKSTVKDINFILVNSNEPDFVKPELDKIKREHSKNQQTSTPDTLKSKPQSKTVFQFSKTPHKGYPPKNHISDTFEIPISKIKSLSSDTGFGAEGPVGYFSPNASSTSSIDNGKGTGGKGRRKGGKLSFSNGHVGSPQIGKSSNEFDGVLKDPDLNPYISNLQRRIKRNWIPPKGNENKKVVLFLRISKEGKLLILNVKDTSLNPDTDNAAISAIKKAMPFRALPTDFRENYLDLVFTFDFNILSHQLK